MSTQTRMIGQLDAQGRLNEQSYNFFAFLGDYTGGTNLVYKGIARPGSVSSTPVWQIAKLGYDGNNNLVSIMWPQNSLGAPSNDFVFIWNNRTTYTYV